MNKSFYFCKRLAIQSGIALISALLVIILITSLLSVLYSSQINKISSIENNSTIVQSRWLMYALIDGIRYLLQDDYIKGKPVDHLGEIWALPVSDSNLDILLKKNQLVDTSLDTKNIFISYKIEDAQGRFNLANLAGYDDQSNAKATKSRIVFKLLISKLGVDQRIEGILADKIKYLNKKTNDSTGKTFVKDITVTEAELMRNLNVNDIKLLEKYVFLLPEQTAININTADEKVLAALIPDISPVTLLKLTERRQKAPFANLNDLIEFIRIEQPALEFSIDLVGVRSNFFKVYAAIRYGNAVISQSLFISRKDGRLPITEIIRSENENFKIY